MSAIVPIARIPVSVRPATLDDLPFIDALQKQHQKQVGFLHTKALEGKIKLGHVIVAEAGAQRPVGYCIGNDQYFKRDDVGIIYQLNVVPEQRRSLVGAILIQAMFDRAAYGCRLFCCWCAQDIEANHFWESLGFIPLAFRAGSRDKGPKGSSRVHIFWQKRIRAGDTTTPFWFPSKTSAGAIVEERLVLPIPPGTHWSDAKPIILPGAETPRLEDGGSKQPRAPRSKAQVEPKPPVNRRQLAPGALRFKRPEAPAPEKVPKKREPRPRMKNDPRHVAAARELRDRYLEQVNSELLLPQGKYDVSRQIALPSVDTKQVPLLTAA